MSSNLNRREFLKNTAGAAGAGFWIAGRPMRLGKHAYVEKPLTHSIYEARTLTKVAAEKKLATQMGNQGHSTASRRRLVEALQQGIIGKVTEVHAWTNRPIWPQAIDR